MRKQRVLPYLLPMLLAALLAACGAPRPGSAPDSALSAPPAQSGPAASAPQSAPADADGARTLSAEEAQALWARLEGVWRLWDEEAWDEYLHTGRPLYAFLWDDNGQMELNVGIEASEWRSLYFDEITEQDGTYRIAVTQAWGMMFCNAYEPGAGDVLTLTEEDGGLTLQVSVPARYGQAAVQRTAEGDEIGGVRWRPASDEEVQRALAEGEGGELTLENGDGITAGYATQPTRYRRETPEETRARMGE